MFSKGCVIMSSLLCVLGALKPWEKSVCLSAQFCILLFEALGGKSLLSGWASEGLYWFLSRCHPLSQLSPPCLFSGWTITSVNSQNTLSLSGRSSPSLEFGSFSSPSFHAGSRCSWIVIYQCNFPDLAA